ncbi:spore germination protein YaaH [Oxobacter pfennigii]|uniref:Spore germination protein YaaH n=1 Tax=Oxobacter pfennigii TaxID=36849 RepID=A0A0N8NT48_9CLOT|nr:glycosyl hydrolase family 18 protein [Oxobacter pfennigii]KPU43832.1 spore germination protein YaaH [Oxobacter pfennigii]
MVIHVVKPGENIYSIARSYGVLPSKIIADNELSNPDQLVVGQTIVILEGERTHRVAPGQSIYSIARMYGVTSEDILAANPSITSPESIDAGQIINIPQRTKKLGTLEVNGYALPNIDMEVLNKTLPNLTYLSIFSYEVNPDGSLRTVNDEPLIQAARDAGVAPIMVITNIEQGGGFNSDVARAIFNSEQVQETLLQNVINTLRTKNYHGLDIDFEYIYPEDREKYNNFLRKAVERLRPLGYTITSALAPKNAADQPGLLYEAHDYPVHGELLDHVILMTYEWGHTYGPPMAVAPLDQVRRVLDYAVTAIPSQKILMGIPNYGYDWKLPYAEGTAASAISNPEAVNRAREAGAAIQFDQKAMTPFFNYRGADGSNHVVWFEDARSIEAKLRLANEFKTGGVSYWTINRFFPQNWLVLNSLFDVRKVI